MLGLITALLGAVTEGLKLANTKESLKYVDQVTDLQLQIQKEEARPREEQDDAKIVELYKQMQVWAEGAKQAMQIMEKTNA